MSPTAKAGLEDVVAASSRICFIDGEKGILVYCGYEIGELAEHATFEEVAYLLWHGSLPRRAELEALSERLAASRGLPDEMMPILRACARSESPMAALRTAVSALALFDPDAEDNSPETNQRKAIRLTSQMATIVAAYDRLRKGKDPIPPVPKLSHAANFLYMLTGNVPDEMTARALDVCLVLHAEHGFNASTFAARVTASTQADMHSAICSAIGTLKGPLHGGANTRVMEMLVEIGKVERVEPYLGEALAAKKRIMGFGHRVYHTLDPRARFLKKFSEELAKRAANPAWYEISREIETRMRELKGLDANVDFYSASTYYMMGIPHDLFTPVFAVARIAGWSAHVLEQMADNRLIRPREDYTGPMGLKYVPMEKR